MARIAYENKNFRGDSLDLIDSANSICAEYAAQNLSLTLRQLYYQFVARGLLGNTQQNYKRLGSILNDARMAGAMDWDYLVDRTRNLQSLGHWDNPADIISSAARSYRTDRWSEQKTRVEVWIEKDAGIGVIESVCERNDVDYFSCRGYTSVSEIWSAAQRIRGYIDDEQAAVTILHVGDHDPSGLDMSRDIEKRLRTFLTRDWLNDHPDEFGGDQVKVSDIQRHMFEYVDNREPLHIKRIALNYDQVLTYNPPPNPAKTTDARFQKYVQETGLYESWELDALDPAILQNLIQDEIDELLDHEVWEDSTQRMEHERELLTAVSSHWGDVSQYAEDQEWVS